MKINSKTNDRNMQNTFAGWMISYYFDFFLSLSLNDIFYPIVESEMMTDCFVGWLFCSKTATLQHHE